MKIGIDARLIEETGVGRYIRNLIANLAKIDHENFYFVFLREPQFSFYVLPNNRWQKRLADVPWHSVSEQIKMPLILTREHLDLVHIPYFNVPIFYPGKFIVTIHDLTILHISTGKATTLPKPFYMFRRIGYHVALSVGLIRSSHIIAVSENSKKEILDHFQIPEQKISVIYEGVSHAINEYSNKLIRLKDIPEKYFLYVGNVYPHKNVERLINALTNNESPLVLVGKNDYFYEKLRDAVTLEGLEKKLVFFGIATEQELYVLYKNAIALVVPSLMEGFGLPGLEAMSVGTPVVASDIPVFREIYGNAALYFDPKSEESIRSALQKINTDKKSRTELIEKGKLQAKKYSWEQMAKQTLAIYDS